MVDVWTARINYRGADRLDVSRKGNDKLGVLFAPSVEILSPMLNLRNLHRELAAGELHEDYLNVLERATWRIYEAAYTGEMRESYRQHRDAWKEVFRMHSVTLCCYCTDPAFCHRTVLAKIFRTLKATVCGERTVTSEAGAV